MWRSWGWYKAENRRRTAKPRSYADGVMKRPRPPEDPLEDDDGSGAVGQTIALQVQAAAAAAGTTATVVSSKPGSGTVTFLKRP